MKLLIIDDEEQVTSTLVGALQGEDLEVLVANSTDEALSLAVEHRPDYATIDFYIDDRNGNEVARELRQILPDLVMAGLTGGDPRAYDEELFAIRESKMNAANEERYPTLVRALQEENPQQAYFGCQVNGEQLEQLFSLYILVQGYNLGQRLLAGEQPVEGVKLPIPEAEAIDSLLLSQEDNDIEPMLDAFARIVPAKDDPLLQRFYSSVRAQEIAQLDTDVTLHAERVMEERLTEAYNDH